MTSFTESVVEQAALAWLECSGCQIRNGAEVAPGKPADERDDCGQVVPSQPQRAPMSRLVPGDPLVDDADEFMWSAV